ncbi:MAG: nuclear transport factor 2 family protein [Planctomycetota bacterium]|nr:nuclear transport factor 2 family protein [Planctomycetota bacterium]
MTRARRSSFIGPLVPLAALVCLSPIVAAQGITPRTQPDSEPPASPAPSDPAPPVPTPPAPSDPAPPPPDAPLEFREFTARDGRTVRFLLRLPTSPDERRPSPMVVALPPGKGDEAMVRRGVQLYWSGDAFRRSWILLSPAAPARAAWADEPRLLAELLDHVATITRWENGLAHLAGVSAGGLAAFTAATEDPGRFASLTVLPGAPANDDVLLRLDRLRTVPVTIFVGADDAEFWLPQARRAAARLREVGASCDLRVLEGQAHVLALDGPTLHDALESRRPSRRGVIAPHELARRAVDGVLTDFHDAAAKADEVRYFEHFAPDAVFLGTDATERWTLPQFRAFALPYFQRESAWTYVATARRISVSPSGDTAWFDEMLQNAKLGTCRGSGVLVRTDDRGERRWRIAQYNLSIPVPNALAEQVVGLIRGAQAPADPPRTPPPAP